MIQRIRKMKGEEGFTLVELLVVIVILGVLAGVVVFSVAAIADKGVQSACKADVRSVETALEAYRAKNNAYPGANSWSTITTDPNKFLKSQPSNSQYAITFDGSGVVTVSPACSTL